MKNIFKLIKETPEAREKRQAEEKAPPQNKAKALINNAIKEANDADTNSGKGTDKAPIPG